MDISKVKVGDVLVHKISRREWIVRERYYHPAYMCYYVFVVLKDERQMRRIWEDLENQHSEYEPKDHNPLEVY